MAASLTNQQMKDVGLSKFQKTNLYYTSDPYLLYQDPTWLGFKLFFTFDMPDSRLLYSGPDPNSSSENVSLINNTAYTYLKSIGEHTRAKYLSKFVTHLKNINNKTPWFFQAIEGLDQAWKRGYNSDDFKAMLPNDRRITISCLESIDLRISALMDLYRKSCFDWKYRRELVPWNLRTFTVYVYVYELRNINRSGKPNPSGLIDIQRELNLSDINSKQQKENQTLLGKDPYDDGSSYQSIANRTRSTIEGLITDPINGIKNAFNPVSRGNESSNTPNVYINRFLFRFGFCEFLPDESSEVFLKVSSVVGSESEAAQQKISFSYRDVEEINLYNLWSDKEVTDAVLYTLNEAAKDNPTLASTAERNKPGDAIPGGYDLQSVLNKKFGVFGDLAGGIASLASEKLERLLDSYAGKLLMGNIYGLSPSELLGGAQGILSGDPTQVVRGVEQIANPIFGSPSRRNDTNDFNNLGKIYDQSSSLSNDTEDKLRSETSSSSGTESLTNDSDSSLSNIVTPSDGKTSLSNVDPPTDPGNVYR